MYKHILVPTDGSKFSEDAARAAVVLAKGMGASITALNVRPYEFSEQASKFEDLAEQTAQKAVGFVDDLCQEAGVSCSKLTLTNNFPHEAIIEGATSSGCDLIFMASHGRSGIAAVLLGSVTTKVVTHSKIPVLVHR